MSSGFGGARVNQQDTKQKEFSTINKDQCIFREDAEARARLLSSALLVSSMRVLLVPWQDGKTVWEPGLPALVTSRRQHRSKQTATVVEEPPVPCDLKATLKLGVALQKMSAPSKTEWLEKVLKAKAKAQDSLLQGSVAIFEGSDVFNIVTHPKFASGVSEKYGKKMFQMVAELWMRQLDRMGDWGLIRMDLVSEDGLPKETTSTILPVSVAW
ncbi:unnamed protein product [Durusdinium trenchii]|uniref:Uncharacterized protein n=1 Tax=Durusdinium trenchii TaxID=1381693 RepID=A0ABP0NIG8_9DINO